MTVIQRWTSEHRALLLLVGDSAALMAWLDNTSGHHLDLKRTLIFAQNRSGDPLHGGLLVAR